MTYDILATGSSGNAVVINGEILIDCGVPYKTLEQSGYIPKLKLVLLTHSHGDHLNPATVRALHKERPALRWGCCEWMVADLVLCSVEPRDIDIYITSYWSEYRDFDIMPVKLLHDVPNCGYHIQADELLFYATDTSTLDHIEAKGYDLYLIEANHRQAEIAARIVEKLSRGKFAYEVRSAQNHLSYEQAMEWLAQNAGPNSRYEFLHQHKETKDGRSSAWVLDQLRKRI